MISIIPRLAIAALAAFGGAGAPRPQESEPVLPVQTIDTIDELILELGEEGSAAAEAALIELGAEAVPALVARYERWHGSLFRGMYEEVVAILRVLEALAPHVVHELPRLVEAESQIHFAPDADRRNLLKMRLGRDASQIEEELLSRVISRAGPRGLRALVSAMGEAGRGHSILHFLCSDFSCLAEDQASFATLFTDEDEEVATWAALILGHSKAPLELLTPFLASEDAASRRAGARAARYFGHHAEELAPLLSAALDDDVFEVRYAAAEALAHCELAAVAPLARALDHPDARIRRAAAEHLQGLRWPHRTDETWRGRFAYGAFGPRPEREGWSPEDAADAAMGEALGQEVDALLGALEDEDVAVRAACAVTLLRIGPPVLPALDRIEQLRDRWAEKGDEVTVFWLDQILEAARRPRWWGLRALARHRGEEARRLTPAEVEGLAKKMRASEPWDGWPEPDLAWGAALPLIDGAFTELLRAAEEGRPFSPQLPDPAGVLDELEEVLRWRLRILLRILDRWWGIKGNRAIEVLSTLGPVTLPAMAHDYLRTPRFPIGPPTYIELAHCLDAHGAAATGLFAEALEQAFSCLFVVAGLEAIGPQALPAVPAILRAWRWERRSPPRRWLDIEWDQPGIVEGLFRSIGARARPMLLQAAADPDPLVRARVARALAALGG